MRVTRPSGIITVLGLCLLSLLLLRAVQHPTPSPARHLPIPRMAVTPYEDRFEQALREAMAWRLRAARIVNQKREALEAGEPGDTEPRGPKDANAETLRLQLMARDRGGYLRRAREAARRAAALARNREEKYRSVELLARIEHDAGHHRRELEQARRLMKLDPQNPLSLMVLRRAATCTGQQELADWATARLRRHGYRSQEPPSRHAPDVGPLPREEGREQRPRLRSAS
jgi:hypothetical protein